MTTRLFDVDWGTSQAPLHYRILAGDDTVLLPRTSNGVGEFPAGSGLYRVKIEEFNPEWLPARIVWDDGVDFATRVIEPLASGNGDGNGNGDSGGGGGAVDDVPRELYELLLLALVAPGRTELEDHGDGTKTLTSFARDKSTWLVKQKFNKNGEWLDVEINTDAVNGNGED